MTGNTMLITGVSSGFGRAFANHTLAAGYRVVGTARNPRDAALFAGLHPTNATGRVLDITDEDAVAATVHEIQRDHGPIEVLIANAGYGHEGLFEESRLEDLRRQFDVNVFGTAAVIRAVLPGMRSRRRGHILAVTSVGVLTTSPGLSFYHGSKYAVEGILEPLGKEVAGLVLTSPPSNRDRSAPTGRAAR